MKTRQKYWERISFIAVWGLTMHFDKLFFSKLYYLPPGIISYRIKIQSRCFFNGWTDLEKYRVCSWDLERHLSGHFFYLQTSFFYPYWVYYLSCPAALYWLPLCMYCTHICMFIVDLALWTLHWISWGTLAGLFLLLIGDFRFYFSYINQIVHL